MKMNIALAANELFAIPCMVAIVSVLENNKHNECVVYVLTTGFSKKTKEKFAKLSAAYKQKIEIVTMDSSRLAGVSVDPVFSIMTYFRFFLPGLLIKEDKVLYLDCDMIVRGALDDLYRVDVSEKACAVVEDQWADDVRAKNRLNVDAPTFNAGMLVMNLKYWRANDLAQKCIDYLVQNKEKCIYCDQDAMNALLENRVVYLPYRYNVQAGWLENLNEIPFHHSKWKTLKNEIENAVIMHYSMRIKPWHKESTHRYKDEFLHYANLHAFIGFSVKPYYPIKSRVFRKLSYLCKKMSDKLR